MNKAFGKIVVPFAQRTSTRKAGNTIITLPDGCKVVVMANFFAPDHDRSLFEPTLEWLSRHKPNLIVLAGRIIHSRVVQLLDPESSLAFDEDEPALAPEVELALAKSNIWEERVIELFKLLGENIFKRIAQAAGPQCRLYYIPALDGGSAKNLPPEGLIAGNIERIQKKIDAIRASDFRKELVTWRKEMRESGDESDGYPAPQMPVYPAIPSLRRDFAKLLQIDSEPHIKVLPFGSTITLRCQIGAPSTSDDPHTRDRKAKVLNEVRIAVGSRKVMNPIMEAHMTATTNDVSTILGFPGNLSCGWFTKCAQINSLNRRYMFFAQVGMMFRRERLDFGDTRLDRFASGFFCGHNVQGHLRGTSFPFLRGHDGRRTALIWGDVVQESEPGDIGRRDYIELG